MNNTRTGAVALFLVLSVGAAAAAERVPATAAVVVEAPGAEDAALARQIETLLTVTLEGRNIRRVRFGREDISAREDVIRKHIDVVFARVTAGMRSKPFDDGNEILNRAFFQAKQILGRIDPLLLARLYKAFAAAQITLGRKDLGEDYIAASLNLDKEQSPRSFHYFSDMRRVVEDAHRRIGGTLRDVTIAAEPAEARIYVDGRDLGPAPAETALGGGPHLVQIRADGYHPQGWLKDADAEAGADEDIRWDFHLRPLPAWKRYTSVRREGAAALRLDAAARKAVSGGAQAPAPTCPADSIDTLGRLVDARQVLLASAEDLGGRIAVRGCLAQGGVVTPFALLLARDATLLEKIRSAVEDALETNRDALAAKPSEAERTDRSARDPLLVRLDAARDRVEKRLAGVAARERHHRSIGLAEMNTRFRVVRGPLEGTLADLAEAARIYPDDKILCARLVTNAEDRLRRMKDMLLSMDAWDPGGDAKARDEAAALADLSAATQAVAEARGHWKASRRKLKDRAARKRLDREDKALYLERRALDKAMKKAEDPRSLAGRALQLQIDAKALRRAVDVALEPPPPPPRPVIPDVEPEPVPVPVPEPEPEDPLF